MNIIIIPDNINISQKLKIEIDSVLSIISVMTTISFDQPQAF